MPKSQLVVLNLEPSTKRGYISMDKFTEVETKILHKYISDPKLLESLCLIRGIVKAIWGSDAPRIVKDYTDHGVEHSERLADFVDKLLQAKKKKDFSEQEIYLLFAGIYLHDIGMQCDITKYPEIKEKAESLGAKFDKAFTARTTEKYSLSLEEQKDIRKNHHFLSAAWIDYLYEGKDPVLSYRIKSVPADLVDDLMDICKFHSKLSINDCPDYFSVDPNGHKRMVAALLRFADELDISSTRVNIETVKIFAITPENSIFWWLHHHTNVFFRGSNEIIIKITLHPEDFETYNSTINDEFINKFKVKNQPVLDVLVKHNIPVIVSSDSKIVENNHAEKFPQDIINAINKITPILPEKPKKPKPETEILRIPPRNHYFTGREEEVKEVHEALFLDNIDAVSQPVAVCGLGGIGKTQIAIEYTHRYLAKYEFIFWIKADSEDSIISGYIGIAKLLDLSVRNDSDLSNIVSDVLNWFRIHDKWLLVFDNADDISFVKNYLPPNPKGHILLTSRAQVFDEIYIKRVEIKEMSSEEAKSFLLKRTDYVNLHQSKSKYYEEFINEYDPPLIKAYIRFLLKLAGDNDRHKSEFKALEKLIHELGHLPLALEQAGAYISANNSSFKDYLDSYNKRGLRLLEKSPIDESKYPESVCTTWLRDFEEVKRISEVSADVLFASAFLNPWRIHSEIFYKGANELGPLISAVFSEGNKDPLVFDEVLKPLRQCSLINREVGSRTYDIHYIVQVVLRDGMEKSKQKLWAERVFKAVNCAIPEVNYRNRELYTNLYIHLQKCEENRELFNINTDNSKLLTHLYQELTLLRLYNRVGNFYEDILQFKSDIIISYINIFLKFYRKK